MFQLGDLTLPNPKSFKRTFIETGAKNLLIEGKSTKRIENRKERFTLVFQNLTQFQTNSILSEYILDMVRVFQVTEANLSIPATEVLIDISTRKYPQSGKEYREEFRLILTEVK